MKIKKIDIKAFRLFGNEKISFTAKRNEALPANFVAIYAPNGFGKTSFFDAMEFCMTGKIHRFDANMAENVSEDKKQSGNKSFIHNKEKPGEDVYVKMEFEDKEPVIRTCKPDKEYQLLQGKEENSYFSEAILSQDFFSAFISSKDSRQRFEIFTRRFKETSGLLEYRQWLKTKSNSIAKQIGQLSKNLSKKYSQIDHAVVNKDVHHIVSEGMDSLRSLGYKLSDEDVFSERRLKELRLLVSIWLKNNNKTLESLNNILSKYHRLENGSEEITSIYELLSIEKHVSKAKVDLENFNKQLTSIQKHKELNGIIDKIKSDVQSLESEINNLQYLIDHFEAYSSIKKHIYTLTCQVAKEKVDLENLQGKRKRLENEQPVVNAAISDIKNELLKLNDNSSNLSQRYVKMRSDNLMLDEKTKELALAKVHLKDKEKVLERLKKKSEGLHEFYEQLNQRKLNLAEGPYFEERKAIVKLEKEITYNRNNLLQLTSSIEEKTKYLTEIEQLVSNSRELLSKIGGGVCPLCGFDYNDQKALLESISANTIIDRSLESDFQTKEILEGKLQTMCSEKESKYMNLVALVNKRINHCMTESNEAIVDLNNQSTHVDVLSFQLDETRNILTHKYSDISDLSEEQARQLLDNQIIQNEEILKDKQAKAQSFCQEIENTEKQINKSIERIELANNDVINSELDEVYVEFRKYSTKCKINEIKGSYLLETKESIQAEYEKKQTTLKEYRKEADLIKAPIEEEESLVEKKKKVETEIGNYSNLRSKILTYIESSCQILDIQNASADDIIEKFELKLSSIRNQIREEEKKNSTLTNFNDIINQVEKFYQNKHIQKEIELIEGERKDKSALKDACLKEIDGIEKYLEKFVEKYFELDLINKLYNTIDPHPDYKQIKFICDFKNKQPRLKVLLNNVEDGKESIVPNLYFSTAQINILSFCIFLAKALSAKDERGKSVDSIFIDDPIQALDDINILSIIDLLRNVAFTMDKQIVLTTHDRNFFDLLRKKVPDKLFNSKYITLPERGKFDYV